MTKTYVGDQFYFLSRIVGPLGCVTKACMNHVFPCRAQASGERKSYQKPCKWRTKVFGGHRGLKHPGDSVSNMFESFRSAFNPTKTIWFWLRLYLWSPKSMNLQYKAGKFVYWHQHGKSSTFCQKFDFGNIPWKAWFWLFKIEFWWSITLYWWTVCIIISFTLQTEPGPNARRQFDTCFIMHVLYRMDVS